MVSFQEPPPRVGVDLISGDVAVVNNESGSYESKFKYHARIPASTATAPKSLPVKDM
jgi:hypothetical protein